MKELKCQLGSKEAHHLKAVTALTFMRREIEKRRQAAANESEIETAAVQSARVASQSRISGLEVRDIALDQQIGVCHDGSVRSAELAASGRGVS